MKRLTEFIIFPIHLCLQLLNLGFWGLLVLLFGLVKLVVPIESFRQVLLSLMHKFYFVFSLLSVGLIKIFNRLDIQVEIDQELSKQKWYLITVNHVSYLDVILMIYFCSERIPPPKFFLKKELIWKHPTTVINFVEGTRFTKQKQRERKSPYSHLLRPKAGGIAFTLAAMGELFSDVLDITIAYPQSSHPMMDMLCGRMTKIVIDVNTLAINDDLIGDYFNNQSYQIRFLFILRFKIARLIKLFKADWDEELRSAGVFRRIALVIPGAIMYFGADALLIPESKMYSIVSTGSVLFIMIAIYMVLQSILTATEQIYKSTRFAKKAPITGFIQVGRLLFTLGLIFLIISELLGKSPIYLLSGLTAIAAVLLLVFKDTILGFVAGIQIAANRMFNTGDWIEMPKYGVDGEILEIGLTVVKVQNWDKTISTLPSYSLITEAFCSLILRVKS